MVSKILRADGVTELASIKSVTYHESVNADIDLRPGCVASSYIEVTCFGQQSDAPDVGEALTYYQVVGETETLIGVFYAEPSIPTKNSYSFVAYDAVHKLDADFSAWLSAHQDDFPYTVYQLVSQACSIAGVTLGTSSWTFNAMSVNAFYADGITCRTILQYAAEIACKFVRCNTSGQIIFDWYSAVSNQRIYPSSGTSGSETRYAYKQDGLTYDNYDTSVLARVAVHPVGEDDVAYYYPADVTSGNTLNIANNALLYGKPETSMTNIARNAYNEITAVGQYRPMTVDMFPNECPFKSGQIVPVTDAQGVSFMTAIMSKVVTDSAVTLTSTGREVYGDYALDTAKKLIQLAADIVQINKLKVDWAEIGTAIINTLEANGINADWINTGVLTVKDANDRVLFSADINNHTVSIAGLVAESYYGDSLRLFKEVYASSDGASFSIKPPSSTDRSSLITMVRYFANRETSQTFRISDYSGVGIIKFVKTNVDPVMGDITYSAYSIEFQNDGIYFTTDNTGTGTTLLRLKDTNVLLGLPDKWRSALGLGTDGVLPITIGQGGTGATGRLAALGNFGIYINGIAQLGLTGTPTMKTIADTMPNNSIGLFVDTEVDQSALTPLPNGAVSEILILKYTSNRTVAIGSRNYANIVLGNARLAFAAYNGSSWLGWKQLLTDDINGYLAGETLSFTSALYNVMWVGLAPNTTIVRFEIPLTRPVLATSASVSGSVRIRGGGINSLVSLADANVATAVTINPCGIGVQLTFSSQHFFSANMVVTVHPETSFSITFS